MNKSAEKLIKPSVMIDEQNLNAAGFIQSGKRRFKEVVIAFSDDLFLKSVKYSDAGASNNEREVSADDVYNAVKRIYAAPLQQHKKWNLCLQILEYIFAILVGVGASNLKEMWGLLVFLVCFILATICFVIRTLNKYE